jgi:hypothetical protein
LWDATLSFFPQFLAVLREQPAADPTTAVIGASDGKFVLPLVHAGHYVLAVERDRTALYGGLVELPGGAHTRVPGLPVERRHDRIEHYTTPDRLAEHFGPAWRVLLTLATSRFVEQPHLGQPYEHDHRMGLLIARREPRSR